MRLLSRLNLTHTLYTVSNTTTRSLPNYQAVFAPALLRTPQWGSSPMPISFLGSLFSSAPSRNMTYPVEKAPEEWRKQLSDGEFSHTSALHSTGLQPVTLLFFLKRHIQANRNHFIRTIRCIAR